MTARTYSPFTGMGNWFLNNPWTILQQLQIGIAKYLPSEIVSYKSYSWINPFKKKQLIFFKPRLEIVYPDYGFLPHFPLLLQIGLV